MVLCDGSPGIGCPVIASLTGASLALLVVEPTVAGQHDFLRVAQLTSQLGVPAVMAVNKADLNQEITENLEALARQLAIAVIGRIPYDRAVTQAQIARQAVVEFSDGRAAQAIRSLWVATQNRLQLSPPAAVRGLVQLAGQNQECHT